MQVNFPVATKHLKGTQADTQSDHARFPDLAPSWTHTYVTMNQKKARQLEPYDQFTTLLGTLKPLGKTHLINLQSRHSFSSESHYAILSLFL